MHFIAYLDPGTGTLIVQAVLGGAAGAAVLLKTTGRRFFRKGSEQPEPPQDAADGDLGDAVSTSAD